MISTNSSGESTLNIAPDARTALISGYDLISELLEDFRCEKTTYEVMEYGAAVEMACNASHELVGIFVLEGAAEIALRDGLVEQLGTYKFALKIGSASCREGVWQYV